MAMETLLGKLEQNFTAHHSTRVMSIWYDHMSYLKHQTPVTNLQITDHQSIKYEGDYWGLLSALGISSKYHPFLTVFNGYNHPSDYRGTPDVVQVPDMEAMETVLRINLTRNV